MAEGGFDNIEMQDRKRQAEERERERQEGDQETNLDDDDRLVNISHRSHNTNINRVNNISDGVPNPKYDKRTINTSITRDRKQFLLKHLDAIINVGDGEASENLIHNSKVIFGVRGSPIGLEFENVRVMVKNGKSIVYSNAKASQEAVKNFKSLLEDAIQGHMVTLSGMVEEINGDNTIPDNVTEAGAYRAGV